MEGLIQELKQMKLKALCTAEVIREKLQERFAEQIEFTYDGYYIDHEVMPHAELIRKVKGYDILICEYDTVSRDVIDSADKLRLIICCRGGVKSVIDTRIRVDASDPLARFEATESVEDDQLEGGIPLSAADKEPTGGEQEHRKRLPNGERVPFDRVLGQHRGVAHQTGLRQQSGL